jgi:2-aminoadipate transaminase
MYEFCRAGHIQPQIERLKKLYAPRLKATLAALDEYLPEAEATRPDGGFFLSLTLPEGVTTMEVRTRAAEVNLKLADGRSFFADGGGERFLRLPFCALNSQQLQAGVARLADVVRSAA